MNPTRRLRTKWWLLALSPCLLSSATIAADLSIQMEPLSPADRFAVRFLVRGLPGDLLAKLERESLATETWQQAFGIFTVVNGKPAQSAMLGEYGLVGGALQFVPRFPLRPGMTYRAVLDPEQLPALRTAGLARVEREYPIAARDPSPPTRLTHIFPTAEVVPENLLKFYLHFSAPMSRGEAYRRIQLLDDKGQPVTAPFLELGEELWSPDGKRFTLYFDPGRIKRGLQPRELFGPALLEGHSYTLVVHREWVDANQQPLVETVRKPFRVVAPDDVQPQPGRWKLTAPAAGTRAPLRVAFDEALDAAMLQRVLEVRDARQRLVAGEVRVAQQERLWTFEPAQPWSAGTHYLSTATTLEDLAGNSIGRPFEVDVFRPANPQLEQEVVQLRFQVESLPASRVTE
ncbi:MAG: Ig-like domain-containing protein [Pirellulaceae bacterium]